MKKTIMENIIVFLLGAGIFAYAFTLKGQESWAVSPALFVALCGAVIAVLSFFIRVKTDTGFDKSHIKTALALGALILYGVFFGKVHFIIISSVLLIALQYLAGRKNIWDNIIFSVLISGAVYFVFGTVLGVKL